MECVCPRPFICVCSACPLFGYLLGAVLSAKWDAEMNGAGL